MNRSETRVAIPLGFNWEPHYLSSLATTVLFSNVTGLGPSSQSVKETGENCHSLYHHQVHPATPVLV